MMIGLDSLKLGWGRRLPMVLQTEAAECGLACLAMIVAHFGSPTDIVTLRRRYGLSMRGVTLKDLIEMAGAAGLGARPVRLEMDELALLKTPCIIHWDLNHFVVLKSVGRNDIVIHDPAAGVRRFSLAEASKHFTGVALELTPANGFEKAEAPPRVRMRALLGRFVGIGRSLAELGCLALAVEVLAVASPFFLAWVIDQAVVSADSDLLVTLVIGFTLLLLLETAISAMRGWMVMSLSASLKVQARSNLFSHLIRLPASYFETRYLADVLSRFGSQETIIQAITTDLVVAVMDGLVCLFTLAMMFVLAPRLALIVVTGAALYAVLRWAAYTPLRQASMEAIVWNARRDSHFLETLRGIKAIKLFNAHADRRAHWLTLLVETINRQLTAQKLQLVFRTANGLLLGLIAILVIWLGASEVIKGAFSVGLLVAFIAYKDQFLHRVIELINRAVDLKMLNLHSERLADIALTAPEVSDHSEIGPVAREFGPVSVEVRNLSFRYSNNDRWVLDGVSFRLEGGESVAITGASGCGKTTLLKIMAGLLQPTSGEVLIDGRPLAAAGLERYRAMIGVVMQDDQLFAGSIADNIAFFAASPDFARIEQCARMAAIHDDIVMMPMGYGTLIGDMGTVLSGGQKQRVLIARALYRQPSLLLLDEATSHLDVGHETAVNAAIRSESMTRIIIAHRPETIRSAKRIVHLEDGKVVPNPANPAIDATLHRGHAGGPVALRNALADALV